LGLNEDPADPQPPFAILMSLTSPYGGLLPSFSESERDFYGEENLVRSMEARPEDLPACAKQLPRLAGKSWWLTKQVETFAPEEVRDLEFEPAIPIFAEKVRTPEGLTLVHWLPQFGQQAVPLVLAGLTSPELAERRLAVSAMAQMEDTRLVAPLTDLLGDTDPRIRTKACECARVNWDSSFAPRLVHLLSDKEVNVRSAACQCLEAHPAESASNIPVYLKMVEDGSVPTSAALFLLRCHGVRLPKATLVRVMSSTDPYTITLALESLHDRNLELNEISQLLSNSLAMARSRGLSALLQIGDKAAMDRIVAMLRDPNEGLRWAVRANLRRLSGKKLGADPAAWEKWWAENRKTFTPRPAWRPDSARN